MPRKVAWNLASWTFTAVYGFAVTRLIVQSVGDAGFGLWATVGALRGFVFFLDGGLSLGMSRNTAQSLAGDTEAPGLVRAGWRVYLAVALLTLALFAGVSQFPGALLDLAGDEALIARNLTIWMGLEAAVALLTSSLAAVLRGRQMFQTLACVTGSQTVLAVGLLSVLTPRYGLEGAAWAVVTARGVVFVGAWAWLRARSLLFIGSVTPPGAVRRAVVFASPLWLASGGTLVGGGTDVPIVGGTHGDVAAGQFALGVALPGVGAGLLFAILGTYFPRLVSMTGAAARHLTGALIFMATYLAALGFGFIAIHEASLLHLWVERAPELAVNVARIFALCWALNAVTHVLSSLAIARGVHKIVGPVVFIEATANLTISIVLATHWSPLGPAVGTLVIMLVTNVFVLPSLLRTRLGLSWSEIVRPSVWGYLLGATAAAVVGLCVATAHAGDPGNPQRQTQQGSSRQGHCPNVA